jgi:hypothetical protein
VVGKNYRLQNIQLSKITAALRASARQIPLDLPISSLGRQAARACRAAAPTHVSAQKAGGEYRARTGDLLVANQALSQLS